MGEKIMKFKANIFDGLMKIMMYFFFILAFCALASTIYDTYVIGSSPLNLSPFISFILLAILCRYYYAVQYALTRLEEINHQQKQKFLSADQAQKQVQND